MARRICTKCKQPGEFYERKTWCKECCKTYYRDWCRRNPERVKAIVKRNRAKPAYRKRVSDYRKEYRRKGTKAHEREKKTNQARRLRVVYGLTPEAFEVLRTAHDDRCAICRQVETRKKNARVKSIAIDHDHVTGEVRGLLCHQCNTGIGCFKDSPELLETAIRYLRGEQRFGHAGASIT